MIQLNKSASSTILADVRIRSKHRNEYVENDVVVNVGKLGIGKRTTVGNAHEYIDCIDSKVSGMDIKVDSEKVDIDTGFSESHILSKRITSSIGKAAGVVIIGSMIAGPPVIGYLLFDLVGLAVGSMISGPFVMIFVWALVA